MIAKRLWTLDPVIVFDQPFSIEESLIYMQSPNTETGQTSYSVIIHLKRSLRAYKTTATENKTSYEQNNNNVPSSKRHTSRRVLKSSVRRHTLKEGENAAV